MDFLLSTYSFCQASRFSRIRLLSLQTGRWGLIPFSKASFQLSKSPALTRQAHMTVVDRPRPCALLTLKTYVSKCSGVTCIREVEIINNKNSMLLVKSKTNWCMTNPNTKKPKRIPTDLLTVFD